MRCPFIFLGEYLASHAVYKALDRQICVHEILNEGLCDIESEFRYRIFTCWD